MQGRPSTPPRPRPANGAGQSTIGACMTGPDAAVRHDAGAARFATSVDGQQAHLDYRLEGEVMTITHTRVPEAISGRGIAGRLVRHALQHARDRQWRVDPVCSYADAWMRRHPEFDALRAA